MLKLAVIGTNWITHKFIEAALASQRYVLTAVYSRTEEQAKMFAQDYQDHSFYTDLQLFTDLDELAKSDAVDIVYIASPNSLHAKQAEICLHQGKHVIVEKPIASNNQELATLIQLAKAQSVILFEAFKTPYIPNFKVLKANLNAIGKLRFVNFNFCQYSSRYPRLLAGEFPNTFNPTFSNGSLMDIGFYCIAAAAELFGKPNAIHATALMLESGVDGLGTVCLDYDDFLVHIQHSKISNSYLQSEVQGEDGAIMIEHLSNCTKLTRQIRDGELAVISSDDVPNTMIYEAKHVADLINNNEINHAGLARTQITMDILSQIRKQIGLQFPADLSN